MRLFRKKDTLLDNYRYVMDWIRNHTTDTGGVMISDRQHEPYPEVTGYLIPSLLEFGEHSLAERYSEYLHATQNLDGSWNGSDGKPSFFDTGQVIRGLLAIREYNQYREIDNFITNQVITHALFWMADQVNEEGSVRIENREVFRFNKTEYAPEQIMLYALEPMRRAAKALHHERLLRLIDTSIFHYKEMGIPPTLSHYQAYIEEALIDLGEPDVFEGSPIPKYQSVPGAYQSVVVAAKMGMPTRLSWLGLKGGNSFYFPKDELSWSAKFFLDALDWDMRGAFRPDRNHPKMMEANDSRYEYVKRNITGHHILDAGAGTGRIAELLKCQNADLMISCLDISPEMVSLCRDRGFPALRGSLMNIPHVFGRFDSVYCVEALEHCVNKPAAIRELFRVVKTGGRVIIVDKSEKTKDKMILAPWEEWPNSKEVIREMGQYGTVSSEKQIDNIFTCWVGVKG